MFYLRGEVALGAHPGVGGNVQAIILGVIAHCEPQVSDGTGQVTLHQDVLALQVPVGNGRLACTKKVKMGKFFSGDIQITCASLEQISGPFQILNVY